MVEQWYSQLHCDNIADESRLVVADCGSMDGTHEILEKLQTDRFPKLEILNTGNQYHGPKLMALYDYAIKQGADFIFQTDSDGQTNPEEFDEFWKARKDYDAIIGNRSQRGDGKDRAFVEKVVCLLLRAYFFC